MDSLQGHLLLAAPRLLDPNFRRTVVLLIQHSDEGALGLVLNRPTKARINEVWSQVSETPCTSEAVLHLGGPVEGPLMALHRSEELADSQIVDGVYFTPEPAKIQQLVGGDDESARLFVGYAGWGAGQLEHELREGSWFTCRATREHVFERFEDLWETVFKQLGKNSAIAALNIRHVPPDPRMN
ncbi:MAG TPA: YqgE/AlgH family protein [Pirellulales bacterium]|jgi:putative transcriptional regulator|nr:YqgE/AlgH family protein [Pirellulales bacterium]